MPEYPEKKADARCPGKENKNARCPKKKKPKGWGKLAKKNST